MEIITDMPTVHAHDPIRHMNFERFTNTANDCYLFMILTKSPEYNNLLQSKLDTFQKHDKEKIVFTLEEPNFCTGDSDHLRAFHKADRILTIDPYIAQVYYNREAIFFPFNEEYIPKNFNKKYDVIYSGHIFWNFIQDIGSIIKNHNYVFISNQNHPYVNFKSVTHQEKINLYAQSKIAIVHNLVFINPADAPRYAAWPHSEKIESFKALDKNVIPQIKSRVFEAAFSKSLILCYKDNIWNIIENYFTPDKDFIYFENAKDLEEKITYIKNNYDKYLPIIENAYNKAINNYTTKKFIEKYIGFK